MKNRESGLDSLNQKLGDRAGRSEWDAWPALNARIVQPPSLHSSFIHVLLKLEATSMSMATKRGIDFLKGWPHPSLLPQDCSEQHQSKFCQIASTSRQRFLNMEMMRDIFR